MRTTLFLLCIVFLSSCRIEDGLRRGAARQQIGTSVQGVPINAWVYELDESGALLTEVPDRLRDFEGETVLLFGAIHGDEPLGIPLLERLGEAMELQPELVRGRRVILVPLANPDGYRRRIRVNHRGVDLNRNFPSTTWKRLGQRHGVEPASEPETQALIEIVNTYRPTRILSIHAPLHCVNYDGPAEGVAQSLAEASGYPVREHIGYPTPGSFGSWAGIDRGIPVITLEYREDLSWSEVWQELGQAMIAFVRFGDSGGSGVAK